MEPRLIDPDCNGSNEQDSNAKPQEDDGSHMAIKVEVPEVEEVAACERYRAKTDDDADNIRVAAAAAAAPSLPRAAHGNVKARPTNIREAR